MTDRRQALVFETGAAHLTDLPVLQAVVARACQAAGAPPAVRGDVRLAVEEAFANIILHGYRTNAPGPVRGEARGRPGRIEVRLEDEAEPWEPADVPAPPLAADWSERKIGGLGWHLIGQLMDEVRHARRTPRGNVLTLVKRWEP